MFDPPPDAMHSTVNCKCNYVCMYIYIYI